MLLASKICQSYKCTLAREPGFVVTNMCTSIQLHKSHYDDHTHPSAFSWRVQFGTSIGGHDSLLPALERKSFHQWSEDSKYSTALELTITLAKSLSQFIILLSCLILSSLRSEKCRGQSVRSTCLKFSSFWSLVRAMSHNQVELASTFQAPTTTVELSSSPAYDGLYAYKAPFALCLPHTHTHLSSHHLNLPECYVELALHTLVVCPQSLQNLSLLLPGSRVQPRQPGQLTHRCAQIRKTSGECSSRRLIQLGGVDVTSLPSEDLGCQ